MRIRRKLVAAAVVAVCIFALPTTALAATASVTGLASPTHPAGQWTASANPSFQWGHSIDWGLTHTGACDTPGLANAVVVSGTTAYVADERAGFRIVDISDPALPRVLASYDTPGSAMGIAVSGTTLYVADFFTGLLTFDVSDPASPVLIGTLDTPGAAQEVTIVGKTAYVADSLPGLHIIDVSDPAAPVLLGTCDTPYAAYGVSVSGTTACVADGTSGLQVIDVSNPAAPVRVGSYATAVFAYNVELVGTTAYLANSTDGLLIIDVSNPAAPVLLGSYNTSNNCNDVVIVDETAYVADYGAGLAIIDVSNPAAPVLAGTYKTPRFSYGIAVMGTQAYIADESSGLQIIDISTAATGTFEGYSYVVSPSAVLVPDSVTEGSGETTSVIGLADGVWYLHMRPVFNGIGRAVSSLSVWIDTLAPNVGDDAPTGWQSADVTLTVTAEDVTSGVRALDWRRIDPGGAMTGDSAVASSHAFAITAEGTTTLEYSAADFAENRCATETAAVLLDKTDPVIDVVVAPAAPTNQPVSITFLASDALSGLDQIWYRVNGGLPQLYAGVPFGIGVPGQHTVEAWAVDLAGNLATESAEVTIDTLGPAVSDDAPSGWVTANTTVTVVATDTVAGVAGIDWVRTEPDGATSAGADSAVMRQFAISTEGTTTIRYSAVDLAGNRSATETALVRLDKTAPSLSAMPASAIPSGNWIQAFTQSVALEATDALTASPAIYWSIDGGEYVQASPLENALAVGHGWHVLSYYATDDAGNHSTMGSYTCGLDPEVPTAAIFGPPESTWVKGPVSMSVIGSSTAAPMRKIRVDVEGEGSTDYAGGTALLTVTGEGQIDIGYQAFNQTHEPSLASIPGAYTVWIDSTPPTTTADVPTGWQNLPVVVALHTTDPMSALDGTSSGWRESFYRIGAGSVQSGSSPTITEEGATTVTYWSEDWAGNAEEPKAAVVYVDMSDPTATDDAPLGWLTHEATVTIAGFDALSGAEQLDWTRREPGGATSAGSARAATHEFGVSAEGTTTITYAVVDAAMNRSSTQTATVRIDTIAPSTVATHEAGWQSAPMTVTLSPTDAVSGLAATWYRIGAGPTQRYSDPFVVGASGETTVTFWSVDAAGNSEAEKTAVVRHDTAGPTVADDAPAGWVSTDVDLTLSATDSAAGVASIDYVVVDPSGARSTATVSGDTTTLAVYAEGTSTVEYSATDAAGSRSATQSASVRVDKGLPRVVLDDVSTVDYLSKFRLSGADALSGVTLCWRIGQEPEQRLASSEALVTYAVPGSHSITVWAVDGAGNTSAPLTRQFVVTGPAQIDMRTGSKTLPAYGSTFIVAGNLMSGGTGVIGGSVVLQRSSDGVNFVDCSSPAITSSGGAFTLSVIPSIKTIYRVRSSAGDGLAAAVGPAVWARPRAAVGTPVTVSRMKARYGYRAGGVLRPRHTRGTRPVRVYLWRWEAGRWKSYGYKLAKVSDYSTYSRYSVVLFPQKTGRWRIRAYHEDAGHAGSWSPGFDYMRVY